MRDLGLTERKRLGFIILSKGFLGAAVVKNLPANAGDTTVGEDYLE